MAYKKSTLKFINDLSKGNFGKTTDDKPYNMNRYVGGSNRKIHPYVSGYWYCLVIPPTTLFGEGKAKSASEWLHITAESFTPPSRTLSKADVPGLGGVNSSFITGQQLTRSFSITFREYQDTPISSTFSLWTSIIDSHYGTSPLSGAEYIPSSYKGKVGIFLCKPTLGKTSESNNDDSSGSELTTDNIDQFYFFDGVFPESSGSDAFASDIKTNDIAALNITFSFDGWYYGKEYTDILGKVITRFNEYFKIEKMNNHIDSIGNL
jgi:hypothetical protein